jgi:hypothetical protein
MSPLRTTSKQPFRRTLAPIAAVIVPALFASQPSAAGDFVQLPPVNLGDTSFLDGMAGPGNLVQVIGSRRKADRFTDDNGNGLPGSNQLEVQALVTQFAHITEHKIFGGFYGAEVLLPVVNIDPDTSLPGLPKRSEGGVGDLLVSPFLLQWTDSTLLGRPYYHRLNFLFSLPTGSYNEDRDVNPGANLYSFNPYYAGTLHWSSKWATSFRLHYLWNSENDSPNPALGADDIQPGQAFHMNYSASYKVTENLRLGIAGYYLKQLTDDKIDGVSQAGSREQVFGIGPGLHYQRQGGIFDLNAYYESEAENRPESHRIVARYSWLF